MVRFKMPRRRYPVSRKGESRRNRKRLNDARMWASMMMRLVDSNRASERTLRTAQRYVCHQLSALVGRR